MKNNKADNSCTHNTVNTLVNVVINLLVANILKFLELTNG